METCALISATTHRHVSQDIRHTTSAFAGGEYSHKKYIDTYEDAFGMKPKGGRLVDFVSFFQVSLVADEFDDVTENAVFEYILNHNYGFIILMLSQAVKK